MRVPVRCASALLNATSPGMIRRPMRAPLHHMRGHANDWNVLGLRIVLEPPHDFPTVVVPARLVAPTLPIRARRAPRTPWALCERDATGVLITAVGATSASRRRRRRIVSWKIMVTLLGGTDTRARARRNTCLPRPPLLHARCVLGSSGNPDAEQIAYSNKALS